MLVDAHAHVDRYAERLGEALDQINAHHILTVGVSMDTESYSRTVEIAKSCRYLIPTFGIHPWEAHRYHDKLEEIEPYLKATPMVGEAGLDFYWVEDKSLYPLQVAVFEHQCRLAGRLSKPMNLHTKGAEIEVLEAIRKFSIVTPIIHWYSGPPELIDSYLKAGCYFTIGVEVFRSAKIQQIAKHIPVDRMLLETDNPGGHEWLTKQIGMPEILTEVFGAVSKLRGIDPAVLEKQLGWNWAELTKNIKGLPPLEE
jgi:TatD DNase family protein